MKILRSEVSLIIYNSVQDQNGQNININYYAFNIIAEIKENMQTHNYLIVDEPNLSYAMHY